MDVSIIIVNYNTKELTAQCIESIFEKTSGVTFEVIVVDNASSDGSQEFFSEDPHIIFVEAGENLGFGRANNKGLELASGKYVFFLNSDTVLVNNAVKSFFEYCESNSEKKIGAVGCLLENYSGVYVHSFGYFPSTSSLLGGFFFAGIRKMFHMRSKPVGVNIEGEEQYVDYVTGADMFVLRNVVSKYGSFDPDFFMYYEDTELQKRWSREGLNNVIIRTPRIIHLEGCSTKDRKHVLNERKLCMGLTSQRVYFKKTKSKIGYCLYRVFAVVNLLPIVCFKYNFRQIGMICKIVFGKEKYV